MCCVSGHLEAKLVSCQALIFAEPLFEHVLYKFYAH